MNKKNVNEKISDFHRTCWVLAGIIQIPTWGHQRMQMDANGLTFWWIPFDSSIVWVGNLVTPGSSALTQGTVANHNHDIFGNLGLKFGSFGLHDPHEVAVATSYRQGYSTFIIHTGYMYLYIYIYTLFLTLLSTQSYVFYIMDLIQNESTTMYHGWAHTTSWPKHPSSELFFLVDELDSLPMKVSWDRCITRLWFQIFLCIFTPKIWGSFPPFWGSFPPFWLIFIKKGLVETTKIRSALRF